MTIPHEPVLGIDFGTTNTVLALPEAGGARVLDFTHAGSLDALFAAVEPLPAGQPPAARNHELLWREDVPASALAREPFIVREPGSGTRAALESFLREARVEPRVVMEMRSNASIKQVVMADLGLSFVSLHTLGLELDQGLIAVLDVEGAPVVRGLLSGVGWVFVSPDAIARMVGETRAPSLANTV